MGSPIFGNSHTCAAEAMSILGGPLLEDADIEDGQGLGLKAYGL